MTFEVDTGGFATGQAQTLTPGASPVFVGLTLSGMTLGSVLFASTGGLVAQDNANFFWDDTNNRLGVGTATPADKLHVSQSSNSAVGAIIENINAGAGAYTWLQLGNDLDRASGVVRNSIANTDFAGAGSLNLFNAGAYSIGLVTNNTLRLSVDGTTGVITTTTAAGASLTLPNTGYLGAKDSGGTTRSLLQLYSDNITYLDGGASGLVIRDNNAGATTGASDGSGNFTFSHNLVVAGTATSSSSITAMSGTAIPAGGTAGAGFKVSSTTNFGVFFGSGAPSLSAAKGSLYLRSDGTGVADRAYINTNGSTTWTAIATAG